MKIIDQRGRLFGKINILDFLASAFLILLIPVFFYGYKIFHKHKPAPNIEWIEINLPCKIIKITANTLKTVKPLDMEIDKNGKQEGQIIWIGEPKPYKETFNNVYNDREVFEVSNPDLLEVPAIIKIQAYSTEDGNLYYYNDQRITAKLPFDFKTDKYSLKVIPQKKELNKEWVELTVKFDYVAPEVNRIMGNGHLEKDKDGNIIGKLKKIVATESTKLSALKSKDDSIFFINDPYRNDIVAVLDLLCVSDDGERYFKNFPIKIGGQIVFSSDMYIISGTIIDIGNKN